MAHPKSGDQNAGSDIKEPGSPGKIPSIDPATIKPPARKIEPVKLGKPRTNAGPDADRKRANAARYKARQAGLLPPVEKSAPLAAPEPSTLGIAALLLMGHAAAVKATGLKALDLDTTLAGKIEAQTLRIMARRDIDLSAERWDVPLLLGTIAVAYVPIILGTMAELQSRRDRVQAPASTSPPSQSRGAPPQPAHAAQADPVATYPELQAVTLGDGSSAHGAYISSTSPFEGMA